MIEDQVIEEAIGILNAGGVVIAPTDSVYGLFCDALNERAVNRISEIKGREASKRYQIAVLKEDASKYGKLSESAEKIISEFWPGDVNIIVEKTSEVPEWISIDTICLTCHKNKIIHSIIKAVGKPLVSTSVNLSGESPATKVDEINSRISGMVDLVVDGGETMNKQPNTIVDCIKNPPVIVREGSISKVDLGF